MADHPEPEMLQGPADNLKQAIRSDAEAGSTPETLAPMLDVHAPHEYIHTWKSFLTHIAAIVVGLLIAVGLEQTVEFLHHRHQRHELDEALQRNGEANRKYIEDDIAVSQSIMDWALEQATVVEKTSPTGTLSIHRMPSGHIYAPDAGIWLSAKASGMTNLLPASAQNWFEDLDNLELETFVSSVSALGQLNAAFAALDQAIVGYAGEAPSGDIDLSTLTAVQRSTVIGYLRSIAEHSRGVMRRLVSYSIDNEYILRTPRDQLDNPKALETFGEIVRERTAAHPGITFAFSAK
jgi:hypothetical protein